MNESKRREQRRTHLDASAVPVERALNARADELIQHAGRLRADGGDEAADTYGYMAYEFRALAEELHWWG